MSDVDETLGRARVEIDGSEYSESCPRFAADPHAKLDALRQRAPLAWDRSQQQFISLDYALTRALLQDPTLLRDRKRAKPETAVARTFEAAPDFVPERRQGADVVIFADGEDHARLRRLIAEPFLARARGAREMVGAIVAAQLDQLAGLGSEVDLVADYAIPIPVRVIATILGLPREDHALVRRWSGDLALGFNPYRTPEEDQRRWRAVRAMIDYFTDRMKRAEMAPADDLISDFVCARERGEPLSEKELVDHCIMMLTAGNLSTTDLIANACHTLLCDELLRARLLADRSLAGAIVEESLRVDPPVTTTDRIAPSETMLGGERLSCGDVVTASLLSANHDHAAYSNPHAFDVDRPARQHLAFGAGAHICLGAPLARLEGQLAVAMLFERYPEVTLLQRPLLRPVPGHLGPEALLCRLCPASGLDGFE